MTKMLTFEAVRTEFLAYLRPEHMEEKTGGQADRERQDRLFRVREIVARFGVRRLPDLAPEHYAAALAQLRQLELAACAM